MNQQILDLLAQALELIKQMPDQANPDVEALKAQIVELEKKIADLEAMIAIKDQAIVEQQNKLADVDALAKQIDSQIADKV